MCHDFDAYLLKARIAEQMRTKKPVVDDPEKRRGAPVPAVPREPETQGKDHDPVPA